MADPWVRLVDPFIGEKVAMLVEVGLFFTLFELMCSSII